MPLQLDRWHLRGLLFVVGTLLVGFAIIVTYFAVWGNTDLLFNWAVLHPSLILVILPYVIVGAIANSASRRGNVIGWCAWIGGIAPTITMDILAVLVDQERLMTNAAKARTAGIIILFAIPASVAGSWIGWRIGSAISKRQFLKPSEDRNADMEDVEAVPRPPYNRPPD